MPSMQIQPAKQEGFTLIEAVVATGLFALTISSILGAYVSTLRINRRTDIIRTASENARYISQYLSKEIKNGQIAYYDPVNSPCSKVPQASSNTLALVNVDNGNLCFYLGDNSAQLSAAGTNLWLIKNNLTAVKVNSTNIKITNLIFYVSPAFNPYTSATTIQPRVTVTANVQTVSGSQDNIIIPIETSVSIPAYDVTHP